MRAVIQRVSEASVTVDKLLHAKIGKGLLVLLAVEEADQEDDIKWLAKKIVNMRIFADENFLMNKSLTDISGELLVVSQFTLYGSTRKGNRPSFIKAAPPSYAEMMYRQFILHTSSLLSLNVKSGVFGADMKVSLCNDGPVTIIIDSKIKE